MWINNNISNPLREGYYKTLVDFDGLGNLKEESNELFGIYIIRQFSLLGFGGRKKKIIK
jgi:hypothetical protein